AGPGYTAIHVCRNTSVRRIVLLDPVPSMLSSAVRLVKLYCRGINVEAVAGVFEYLPLADNSVDGVISTFAFRDAVDHRVALNEFYRILRRGGKLVILDIYRPEDPITNFSVKLYFRLSSSLAAVLLGCIGKLRNYASFINTIERMMTPTELLKELKIRFENASFKTLYPGVGLWTAIK
ncbi:MAG: class I SAM-dependent methyltransferase, partial [Desulfurococcales archaeon]|nr:class I SAM-dependent methyltransferase [Desulfurococcales archaeon]